MVFQTWKVLPDSLLVQFHCFVSSTHQCTEKGGGEEEVEMEEGEMEEGEMEEVEEICCMPVLVMSLACPGNESGLSWERVWPVLGMSLACPGNESGLSWNYVDDQKKLLQ